MGIGVNQLVEEVVGARRCPGAGDPQGGEIALDIERDDVGALRLRTVATKDQPCGDFLYKSGENDDPSVILDLDYWVLIPR